ncbi:hypothetical protein PGQ11_001763 [Apiospora arundinis]|uniref:UBC core domain-containing protein n=1 Tax=Apiospora arundinis TaxID=335852 RepID=A0ABR2JHG5_9PEZI
MAEAAGLALGALGIAGLFSTCIESFDIVMRAKDFGEDFDLLCTQRIRLGLWGETLGLLPSAPGQTNSVPYNRSLDREDIRPSIIASLYQLLDLLTKADVITERYALEHTSSSAGVYARDVAQTPMGMIVLRDSFQRFKERIRKNQKQKSVWKVTRWSIHDCAQFEALVDKVRKLLDGLESITNALGVLQRQRDRLLEEVDSVSDAQSLSLLQDIGSSDSAPAALRAISETASARLTLLSGDSQTYYTAKTGQTGSRHGIMSIRQKESTSRVPQEEELTARRSHDAPKSEPLEPCGSIPQHQRWMSALLASRPDVKHMPVFSPDDIHYGEVISCFKDSDDQSYRKISGQLAVEAHTGVSLAQRVFIELRNIHRAAVPFISAAPVGDTIDKILACIEGPPGTPYKGGIFWITVRMKEADPPLMRFHTRIYHPNIDHAGKICADYAGWWQTAKVLNKEPSGEGSLRRKLPWFSEHITNQYSLGALLVALCGLMASPNIKDPLVPEIAEKYVTEYDGYCDAARLYTQRYAGGPRPAEEDLVFPGDGYATEESTRNEVPDTKSKARTVTSSIIHTDPKGSSSRDNLEIDSTLIPEGHRLFELDWDYTSSSTRANQGDHDEQQDGQAIPSGSRSHHGSGSAQPRLPYM